MRLISSVVELVGAAAVAAGAFTWNLGLGLVVSGVFVLAGVRQAAR